jgi:prepilin signal peptidase PulO-like enzyme (type II secretory pathway)
LSPGALAAISAGSFAFGLVLGVGLEVAINKVPDRPADFHRSRPRMHLSAVMVITGLAFVLAFLRLGLVWRLPLAWFFIAVMIVVAFIDWELMIIPNKIVLPAVPVGLAASIALDPRRWWVYLVAAVGSALFLFILALIWPGGMGAGDIKLALFMGAVLGSMVIAAMFLAFLFGAVVGLVLIASKLKTRKDHIPFGPYLALGSVLALLFGQWMLDAYLRLLG